jgi:hypothetical protein
MQLAHAQCIIALTDETVEHHVLLLIGDVYCSNDGCGIDHRGCDRRPAAQVFARRALLPRARPTGCLRCGRKRQQSTGEKRLTEPGCGTHG